ASGAEVIVLIAMVDSKRAVDIPVQLLVQVVLPGDGVHVGRVISVGRIEIVLATRISRRPSRMRPANAHRIPASNLLGRGEPRAVALPFLLELQRRGRVARHAFEHATDRETKGERVLRADLPGGLVGDVIEIGRRGDGRELWELRVDGGKGGPVEQWAAARS